MEKNRKIELSTILGKGCKVVGKFVLHGGVRIDGDIEGHLDTDGFLLIGKTGTAIANLKAREALISGSVTGDIFVRETLELDKTAIVKGNVVAKTLRIVDGAMLNGFCTMSDNPRVPDDQEFSDPQAERQLRI